jgi:hypothetical protein
LTRAFVADEDAEQLVQGKSRTPDELRVNYGMIGVSNAFAQKYSFYGQDWRFGQKFRRRGGWKLQDVWSELSTFGRIMTQSLLILILTMRAAFSCVLLFSVLVGKEWREAPQAVLWRSRATPLLLKQPWAC